MNSLENKPIYTAGDEEPTYLDIQAAVGISKHMGGYAATDELHRLCHLEEAQEVLDVGCGIGVGPAYIARQFDCQMMAVDISEKMLSWARQRARREGVADRIAFRKADVRELPFEDDRFDAVIVESVLAFVEDKETAIRELIRVTQPGGYGSPPSNSPQGGEEPEPPPPDMLTKVLYIGPAILTEAEWRAVWEATKMEARTIQTRPLEAKQEVRDRIKWVGWRSALSAQGRVLKLLLTNPRSREALKEQLDTPADAIKLIGYALFVGRKPADREGG